MRDGRAQRVVEPGECFGEFRIAISLEITSDKTAKDPLDIEVSGQPTDKPAETPKADAPKADAPKADAPKPEPAKP